MKKRIFSLFLALTLLLSTVVVVGVSAEVTASDTKVATCGDVELTLSELFEQMKSSTADTAEFTLTSDIVLDSSFATIHPFAGKLNGAGHTISGLDKPFINKIDGATIRNLTLEGNITTTGGTAGILAFQAAGTVHIENVTTNGSITHARNVAVNLAGMIGNGNEAVIYFTDCVNNANLSATAGVATNAVNTYVGGFVANYKGDLIFDSCVNNGDIIVKATKTTLIGGFGGYNYNWNKGGKTKNLTLKNCANFGDIICQDGASTGCKVGGFLAIVEKPEAVVSMVNCYNAGEVSAFSMAGGMIGDNRAFDVQLINCINEGKVSATATDTNNCYAAGFIAQMYGTATAALPSIKGCINRGEISVPTSRTDNASQAAGFVAIGGMNFTEFSDNINTGAITGGKYAGGLISKFGPADNENTNKTTFQNNLVLAPVSGTAAGGLFGYAYRSGDITVNGCYYLGADAAAVGENTNATYVLGGYADNTVELAAAAAKTEEELKALSPTPNLYVQQTKAEGGKFNVRLLTGVDSLAYSEIGFQILRVELNGAPSNTLLRGSKTVYSAVLGYNPETGAEETMTAASFDGATYLSALTVKGVPAEGTVTFIVRPYVKSVDGESTTYGNVFHVSFVNGVFNG